MILFLKKIFHSTEQKSTKIYFNNCNRLDKKFQSLLNLQNTQNSQQKSNWVVNLSDKVLPPEVLDVTFL